MVLASLLLAAPAYRIVDLGLPPGAAEVRARAINNRGEVLVQAGSHGFLWRRRSFVDFGNWKNVRRGAAPIPLEGMALNDLSEVVGGVARCEPSTKSWFGHAKAFIWRGNGMEDLIEGKNTEAYGVNNLDDVVGNGDYGVFVRLKGETVWLRRPENVRSRRTGGPHYGLGIAINDRRQILIHESFGAPHADGGRSRRPCVVNGNAMGSKPLALPLPRGFDSSYGLALNNRGTVLALAQHYSRDGSIIYLVRSGRVVTLPLGDAMNGRDEVVGGSPPGLWRNGKTTHLPTFAGWKLESASGINDRGMICGTGLHDGKTRAFVLVPR